MQHWYSAFSSALVARRAMQDRYHRTHMMITSSANHLFANKEFRPVPLFRILRLSTATSQVQQNPEAEFINDQQFLACQVLLIAQQAVCWSATKQSANGARSSATCTRQA
jgi:hypothetical protein